GVANTAYAGTPAILGNFPTSYQNAVLGTANRPGPVHFDLTTVYLGAAVSGEVAADIGADSDGLNNIVDSGTDNADNDGNDDGWLNPDVSFDHCQPATLEIEMTNTGVNRRMYLNVWFDGDRSGDWGQSVNCSAFFGEAVPNPLAHEWIVRDMALNVPSGTNTFTVPTYRVPNSDVEGDHWIRFTLSELPSGTKDGSSPYDETSSPAGYQLGETEDYLYVPDPDPDPVEPGEFVVTKVFDVIRPVEPGDLVTFAIRVERSAGSGIVTGDLIDQLPLGLSYSRPVAISIDGAVVSRGLSYNAASETIGWAGGFDPESAVELLFEVEVDACVGGLTTIINQARFKLADGTVIEAEAPLEVDCPLLDEEDITIEKRIIPLRNLGGSYDPTANPNVYLPGTDLILETTIRNNSNTLVELLVEEVVNYVSPSGVITGVTPIVIGSLQTIPAQSAVTFESEIIYRDWFDQLRLFDPNNRFVSTVTACRDRTATNCLGHSFVLEVEMGDLGDAPSSDNHFGVEMDAYPGVPANFPTVHDSSLFGPKIHNAQPLKLGVWSTYEVEADQGPDLIWTSVITENNMVPLDNRANLEAGSDDGFIGNLNVPSCEATTLDLGVTIRPQARDYFDRRPEGSSAYLNVWVDGNRDGVWSASAEGLCGGNASEQIVTNYEIDVVDLYTRTLVSLIVPTSEIPWLTDAEGESASRWMRVMLTDRPVDLTNGFSNGGSDPVPYFYGEVEDYLVNNDAYSIVGDAADGAIELEEPVLTRGEDPDRETYRFVVSFANLSNLPAIDTELNLSLDGDNVDIERIVTMNRTTNELISDLSAPCPDPTSCPLTLGEIGGGELGRAHVFFSVPAGTGSSDILIEAEINFPNDPDPFNNRDSITFRPTFLPKPSIDGVTLDEVGPGVYDVTLSGLALPEADVIVEIEDRSTISLTTRSESDGSWSATFSGLEAGQYLARAAVNANGATGPSSRAVPILVSNLPIITSLTLQDASGQGVAVTLNDFESHYDWGLIFNVTPGDYLLEATVENGTAGTEITLYSAALDLLVVLTDPDGDGIYSGEVTISDPNQRSLTQAGRPLEISIRSEQVETIYGAEIGLLSDSGRILDGERGTPIAGARVSALPLLNAQRMTVIDSTTTAFDGQYELWILAGSYQLLIEADGYQLYRSGPIDHPGGLLSQTIDLTADPTGPVVQTVLLDESDRHRSITIEPGEALTFINGSRAAQQLHGGGWESGWLEAGEVVTRQFDTVAEYNLSANDQTITVVVTQAPSSPASEISTLFLPIVREEVGR
ncbi:MAG: carboxypeptidase-like regulatory domain-containing protein, partial [Chloroflexota bacterium]